ncbi:hypothetical protein EJ377_17925 [Chryseobacterium arthrosphaerae]|uniref:Uncharacterized protein n=1 Tax=Chryseobacterium arthrosphaerae TaxID=651561 RepID=A0A3S0Q4A1_9FLAO|nr:hypothetical protein EJ377_17925 [Chryseobacterium arthrosphaerae]
MLLVRCLRLVRVGACGNGTNNLTVSSGNLASAGSIGNGMGNKVPLANNGQDVYRTFTSTTAPVYSSLVVNVSAANVAGDYFYTMGTSGDPGAINVGGRLYIRSNGSGFSFGVLRGTEALLCMKYNKTLQYQYDGGFKIRGCSRSYERCYKLYVNPSLSSEPAVADVQYSAAIGTDVGALSGIALLQGTVANAPILKWMGSM